MRGVDAAKHGFITGLALVAPLVVTVFWDSGERYMSTGMFD